MIVYSSLVKTLVNIIYHYVKINLKLKRTSRDYKLSSNYIASFAIVEQRTLDLINMLKIAKTNKKLMIDVVDDITVIFALSTKWQGLGQLLDYLYG